VVETVVETVVERRPCAMGTSPARTHVDGSD